MYKCDSCKTLILRTTQRQCYTAQFDHRNGTVRERKCRKRSHRIKGEEDVKPVMNCLHNFEFKVRLSSPMEPTTVSSATLCCLAFTNGFQTKEAEKCDSFNFESLKVHLSYGSIFDL